MDIEKDIIEFIGEGYSLKEILNYYADEQSFSKTEGWQVIIRNFYEEI
jgi:hypothetical protein